ncbi:MAG: ribonuclease HII [Actinomycetes bacterium]
MAPRSAARVPTLEVEQQLLAAGCARLGAMDEVGRGALGGPVTVGLVVVDATVVEPVEGVRDSKLLTPAARESFVPAVEAWACAVGVGHASAAEVDEWGVTGALRLAGHRALAAAAELGPPPDAVLLDGSHDWLTVPDPPELLSPDLGGVEAPRVTTRVKADLDCAAVAAASVLAKVARDGLMVSLAQRYPDYGWEANKGYGSPSHLEAIRRRGPCVEHRRSWNLPT